MLPAPVRGLLQRPLDLSAGGEVAAAVVAGAAGVLSIYGCSSAWTQGLLGWLAVEAVFYGLQCWRYRRTSSILITEADAAIDPDFHGVVERRMLELGCIFGIQDFLSGWFHGVPFNQIWRGNVLDFIAYGFYCKRVEDLTPEQLERSEVYMEEIERKFGVSFPPGRNTSITFMAHLWEPLRWIHKPLAVFLGAEAMCVATDALLYAQGFRSYRQQGMRYWVLQPLVVRKGLAAPAASGSGAASSCSSGGGTSYNGSPAQSLSPMQSPGGTRSPPELSSSRTGPPLTKGVARRPIAASPVARVAHSLRRLVGSRKTDLEVWDSVSSLPIPRLNNSTPENCPIFFIHGVGFGLTPYLHFVAELTRAFPTRPIILLEARHVSVCLSWRAFSTDAMADAAVEVLQRHGFSQAAFVGHSYGTFVLSRIVQQHRHTVQSMVLMDPVCMLTIYPQLLQNFVYKPPRMNFNVIGLVDSLRFVFSRDLLVAESFCRKFVWHRECLWPEELPEPCLLVLAAEDDLVPSKLLRQLLQSINHPCEVMYHPTLGHGGFLLSHKWRRQILSQIKVMVASGAERSMKCESH
ncbi:g6032 [Coccomyxa elongata]